MNEKLLLQDLVVLLSKKAGITQKDADHFYRELVQLILDCIYENDIVKIKNFGTFKLVLISSRESVDVNTGDKIEIPAHYRLSFVPDKSLKELVNRPFSHFESVLLDDEVTPTFDNESVEENESDDFIEENILPLDDIEVVEEELLPIDTTPRLKTKKYIPLISSEDVLEKTKTRIENKEPIRTEISNKVSKEPIEKVSISSVIRITREKEDKILEEKKVDIVQPIRTSSHLLDINKKEKSSSALKDKEAKPRVDPVIKNKDDLKLDNKAILVSPSPLLDTIPQASSDHTSIDLEDEKIKEDTSSDKQSIVENLTTSTSSEDLGNNQENENDHFEYPYGNYGKESSFTKFKKKLPVIIISIAIAVFAIYQFAKLFDVTPDYEYYMNRRYNLTLTDTLPYLNEEVTSRKANDTILSKLKSADAQDGDSSNIIGVNQNVKSSLSGEHDANINIRENHLVAKYMDDGVLEEKPSDLDSLIVKLDRESKEPGKESYISEGLQIKVVNKAELYLKTKAQKK